MVKIITIPFQDSLQGFDDERLRRFVDSKKVTSLREFFFLKEGCPYLVFVITYEPDLIQNNPSSQTIKQKADESWKKLLSDKDLPLFDNLREWRKNQAETEGVPPYIVFTNKELATLVSQKPQSKNQLGEIAGIESKKIEKYGTKILGMLKAIEE